MENISIFFYTNNLVSPLILEESLEGAIRHASENDCELIITSHFPLLKDYIDSPLIHSPIYKDDFNASKNEFYRSDIYNYVVKDLRIESKYKNFVVGKLPYSYESIFKQILFSLEQASNDNIVLMEHDCFYPKGYINAVKKCLITYQYPFAYCSFASCFLNEFGFFDVAMRTFLLSTCFGKKDLLQRVFSKKLELLRQERKYKFEPLLNIEPLKDKYDKDEIVIEKHLCADKFMDGPVLDIRHQLNASPDILVRDGDYYQENEYWGNAKKYIDMIQAINVRHENRKKWWLGTARQDY